MSKQKPLLLGTLLLLVGLLFGSQNELRKLQWIQDEKNGVNKLGNPKSITITPDGKYVYVAAYGDKTIAIFSRDASTGKLTYTGYTDVSYSMAPKQVIASADSKYLYVKAQYTNYEIDRYIIGSDGSLSSRESFKDYKNTMLKITKDGKNIYQVYGYNRGTNSFSSLSINETTGSLSSSQSKTDIASDTYSIALSPSENYAYVSYENHSISWYSRSTTDGTLTYQGVLARTDADSAKMWYYSKAVIHESGKFYYGSGGGRGGKHIIDTSNGSITAGERLNVLDKAISLAIYGDRLFSLESNDFNVFSISSSDGSLTLLDSVGINTYGKYLIHNGKELVLSPDGNHIYTVSHSGGKLIVFGRQPSEPTSPVYSATKTNISVSWTKSSSKDVAGYNVYRSTTSGFTSSGESTTRLARVSSSNTSYADSNVEQGTSYYYAVKAVDNDSLLSNYSSEIATNLSSDVKLSLDMSDLMLKGWESSADEIGARFAFSDITNSTIVNGALEKKRVTLAAESTGSSGYTGTIEINATIGTKISWKLRAGPALMFSNKGWEKGDLRKFTFTGKDTTINVGKPNITPPGVIAGLDPDKLYKGANAFVTISGGDTYYKTSGLKNIYLTLLTQGSSTINLLSDSTISAVSYQVDNDSIAKATFEIKDFQTIPVGDWQLGIEYKNDEGRVRKKAAVSILKRDISVLEDIITLNNLSLKTDSLGIQTWDETDRLSVLDLRNLETKITMLPGTISKLENLKRLYIDNNDLTSIPPAIGELKRLETLSIANNSIKRLPESIGNLSFLDTLDISGNGIEELPPSVTSLGNLKELDANNNKLKVLPDDINNLRRLKVLTLHDNNLTSLPENIANLDSLKTLSLTGNGFDEIPEEVFSLSNLTLLTVGYNGLTFIPDSLQKLENLQTLRIYGNELRDIPSFLFEMPMLKNIDLAENFLFCENASISDALIPDELSSDDYEVTGLDDQNCVEINVLQALVDSNRINVLPSQLGQLEWFKENVDERRLVGATLKDPSYKLSRNRLLSELPPNIGDLPDLETLNLESNRLNLLPDEIGNLEKLYSLDVSDNYLTELPDTIASMETLISLNIKDNFLYCDKGVQDTSSIPLYLKAGSIEYLTGLYDQRCLFQPYKNLLLSSEYIEFVDAPINATLKDSFMLKSTGTLPIQDIYYEFTSDNFFLLDSVSSLSVNDSSFVKIGFIPGSVKSFDDTLWIHNDAFDSALVIVLHGKGVHSLGTDGFGNLPTEYMLHQNYPNPFNSTTVIKYDLPEGRFTVSQVYNILGKQIRTLFKGHEEAGFKSKVWDGTDDLGRPVSAGVYLYQIHAGEFNQTRKMLLLK